MDEEYEDDEVERFDPETGVNLVTGETTSSQMGRVLMRSLFDIPGGTLQPADFLRDEDFLP